MVPNIVDVVVTRLPVRHGFSRDSADLFLADVRQATARLDAHRPSRPQSAVNRRFCASRPAGRREERSTFLLTIKKSSMNFR